MTHQRDTMTESNNSFSVQMMEVFNRGTDQRQIRLHFRDSGAIEIVVPRDEIYRPGATSRCKFEQVLAQSWDDEMSPEMTTQPDSVLDMRA